MRGEGIRHLRITLVRSPIGYSQRQRRTLRTLGLRRLNDVAEWPDTPIVRGMLDKVSHLVRVEEVEREAS
ncbi:MAG: 50S ribosomal protein L30 [Thermoflexus sp.]